MSVGIPVIGSNTGGIAEIVRDGVDGFLFPSGDSEALASRMMTLLENEPLQTQMGASARRRYMDYFESNRAVQTQARWIIEQVKKAVAGFASSGAGMAVPTRIVN
jgi:glycosyltransferase involved in cell wall biosynthesis